MTFVPPPPSRSPVSNRRTQRLHVLRQRRQQQKQYVRLLAIVVVSALSLATLSPMTRNAVEHELYGSARTVGSSWQLSRQRHRSRPFTETALTDLSPPVRALLDTIAFAEGTHDSEGYRTAFTYKTFSSYSDHPRHVHCTRYQGSRLCSDAAGRYQMLSSTFDSVAISLDLPDFSPTSQDLAAVELIRRRGGLAKIENGDFAGAIALLHPEWASLPGSGYGQPEIPIETLERVYRQRLDRYQ